MPNTCRENMTASRCQLTQRSTVYRGHWCPFCLSHIRELKAIEERIHAVEGQTVIITSEMEEHLPVVRAATDYTGPAIVDTENLLVKELTKRKAADIAVSNMPAKRYDHGMAQPAAFVMQRDGTVLYSWAIVPGLVSWLFRKSLRATTC